MKGGGSVLERVRMMMMMIRLSLFLLFPTRARVRQALLPDEH